MKHRQMSESFLTGCLLALVGGFLDAYTYICRGHVFANAQTGNIVLFGVKLSEKNISGAMAYLAPIVAFVSGIIIANFVQLKFKENQIIHWRQIILLLEVMTLIVVAGMPGELDSLANIMVSFVCSLQVESFRTVHGYNYASTMCTGNLRSATKSLFEYFRTKDADQLRASKHYYGIILFFVIGAAVGAIASTLIDLKAVYLAAAGLLVVTLILCRKTTEYF